jgi:hypothetical protein
MENKADLVIAALQQRVGEIVSQYETHIAILRAEITQMQGMINLTNATEENESNTDSKE